MGEERKHKGRPLSGLGCMGDPGPPQLGGGKGRDKEGGEGSDQASVSPLKSFKVTWSNFKASLS